MDVILYLLAAIVSVALFFAQLRLFSIDRTLKEILGRLPPVAAKPQLPPAASEWPLATPAVEDGRGAEKAVEEGAAQQATQEGLALVMHEEKRALVILGFLGVLLFALLILYFVP